MTETATALSTQLCPRDGGTLVKQRWREAEYWLCPTCQGVRMARSQLDNVLRAGDAPPVSHPETVQDGVEIVEGTALCSCRGQPLMDRMERNGLSLDVCPRCGAYWFDAGELQCALASRSAAPPTHLRSRETEIGNGAAPLVDAILELLDLFV